MEKFTYLIASLALVVGLASCTKDKTPAPVNNAPTVSYAQKIAPVMQNSCVGCHPGYSTHAGVSGAASSISNRIQGIGSLMPQGGPALPDSVITAFNNWIAQGKLDN